MDVSGLGPLDVSGLGPLGVSGLGPLDVSRGRIPTLLGHDFFRAFKRPPQAPPRNKSSLGFTLPGAGGAGKIGVLGFSGADFRVNPYVLQPPEVPRESCRASATPQGTPGMPENVLFCFCTQETRIRARRPKAKTRKSMGATINLHANTASFLAGTPRVI